MNEGTENFLMNAAATNFSITPTSNPMAMAAKTGRVRGVFYRNWTVDNARLLGLDGWVRNRRDGSVEAVFSGDHDKGYEMQFRCRRGPLTPWSPPSRFSPPMRSPPVVSIGCRLLDGSNRLQVMRPFGSLL